MRALYTPFAAICLMAAMPATAADAPEIRRAPAAAQAIGAAHTLRTIPEACARLEGLFTGDAAAPYRFSAVRSSSNCQPRARFVDATKAKPSVQAGWTLNDVIRVPSAACPTQQAIVRVWRKAAAGAVPPKLDAQGQSRLYLQDAKAAAARGAIAAVASYAAQLEVEGTACR
ncbi:MAG: FIG01210548: hypothetical protein [uncultured Lysobacter sp.]|uniref:Secreted protein n=1 Tax=uncultured Lysobacter sp. TaxID=271060 RepID=A0A6J4LRZ6_9GAMM|nr:MAG: FIG01210548: hypothetical protein [uncultured Lysobacter sp.]